MPVVMEEAPGEYKAMSSIPFGALFFLGYAYPEAVHFKALIVFFLHYTDTLRSLEDGH